MRQRSLNVLHTIHDFLPRHRAGSEIYALNLCQELQNRCHVTVFCADYDQARTHGSLTWRLQDGLPVVELANNWPFRTLAETYRSSLVGDRIGQVLDAVRPDVVHVHNLLNLSFELPALARARGIPVVATLHDYTLVCASGGQRLHRAEQHVCHTIDLDRCARCFRQSPFYAQMTVGRALPAGPLHFLARAATRLLPAAVLERTARTAGRAIGPSVTPADMSERLEAARKVFDDVDLFVAPSASLADEYRRLGVDPGKLRVSDYGFPELAPVPERPRSDRLRIGYVGSIVWHKGVHVLIEAAAAAAKLLPTSGWQIAIHGSLEVSPDYVAAQKRAAEGLPIRFMGAFDRNQMAEVFSQIDVLVVPSLWLENSPLVIHEAFMAGVPVIGSRIGGTADLIRDGVNGLLYDPTSATALRDTLQSLIDDPDRVTQLTPRAGEVKSIQDDARGWSAIYADVVQAKAKAQVQAQTQGSAP